MKKAFTFSCISIFLDNDKLMIVIIYF